MLLPFSVLPFALTLTTLSLTIYIFIFISLIMECPFCNLEIIEQQKVFENKLVYVLSNIRPAAKGHCLVIPKRHVENVKMLSDHEAEQLFSTVKMVSQKLTDALQPIGCNYGFNEGTYAGQSVSHFHFHIMPRFKDDNVREYHVFHRLPENKLNLSQEELSMVVDELRKMLS